MSAPHTPGPWVMGQTANYEEALVASHSGDMVAYAAWDGGSSCHLKIENEANARLIAAAPDLLDALEGLLKYEGHMVWCGHGRDMDMPCVCGLNDAHNTATTAIAKARGQ